LVPFAEVVVETLAWQAPPRRPGPGAARLL